MYDSWQTNDSGDKINFKNTRTIFQIITAYMPG